MGARVGPEDMKGGRVGGSVREERKNSGATGDPGSSDQTLSWGSALGGGSQLLESRICKS